MYYATKIKMESGCYNSGSLLEIDSVYIEGCSNPGFFKKNPGTIKVKIWPYPHVTPAISGAGEKYVRSSPNYYTHDNLLDLPRE